MKGTAETGARGTAQTGTMGVVRGAAVDIPTSVVTPGPSKVSTNSEIGIQIKGDHYKRVAQIHTYKEEITKKREKST